MQHNLVLFQATVNFGAFDILIVISAKSLVCELLKSNEVYKSSVFKYRIRTCIGRAFFPNKFSAKWGCGLYTV